MSAPVLLAFDTATRACSVALLRGDQVVERSEEVGQRHGDRLLPMARQLLADAGVALAQLDAVAFGAGPGSFTGLRIACGVAQGLAYGIDRPVLPVGNLAALAAAAARARPQARRVATVIDARMHEVYWAVYDLNETGPVERQPPSLASAAQAAAQAEAAGADTLAGDALAVEAAAFAASRAQRLPTLTAAAADIARLARAAFLRGEALPPAQAMPLYVRNQVAQTIEERLAARAAHAA